MVRGRIKDNAMEELLKELGRPGQAIEGIEAKTVPTHTQKRARADRRTGDPGLPCADLTCPCRVLRKDRP